MALDLLELYYEHQFYTEKSWNATEETLNFASIKEITQLKQIVRSKESDDSTVNLRWIVTNLRNDIGNENYPMISTLKLCGFFIVNSPTSNTVQGCQQVPVTRAQLPRNYLENLEQIEPIFGI